MPKRKRGGTKKARNHARALRKPARTSIGVRAIPPGNQGTWFFARGPGPVRLGDFVPPDDIEQTQRRIAEETQRWQPLVIEDPVVQARMHTQLGSADRQRLEAMLLGAAERFAATLSSGAIRRQPDQHATPPIPPVTRLTMTTAAVTSPPPPSRDDLMTLVRDLSAKVQEQQEFIDVMSSSARHLGLVVERVGEDKKTKHVRWKIVVNDGQPVVCLTEKPIAVGNVVLLIPVMGGSMVVDEVLSETPDVRHGTIHKVAAVDGDSILIGAGGMTGKLRCLVPGIEPGDEVLTVSTYAIGLHHKKPKQAASFKLTPWDEIGGLADVKGRLRALVAQLLDKDCPIATAYGVTPPKGLMLDGPPGNGKTMLARAMATEIATSRGRGAETGLILVSGPEILDMYVGGSERIVRGLFARARRHHDEHGHPALLVIDEAEAVLPIRGSRRSSDVDTTIVPQFLSEMDGYVDRAPVTVLLTNKPDAIDTAVLREGRIDIRITIPDPNRQEAENIAVTCLSSRRLDPEAEHRAMARGMVTALLERRAKGISGATIAATVAAAATLAMRRDKDAGRKQPTGIGMDDVIAAADQARTS